MRTILLSILLSAISSGIYSQVSVISKSEGENLIEILNGIKSESFNSFVVNKAVAGTKIVDKRERVNSKTDFIKKAKFDKNPVVSYTRNKDGNYRLRVKVFIDAYQLRVEWRELFYSDHITTKAKITVDIIFDIIVSSDTLKIQKNQSFTWRERPTSNFHGINLDFTKVLEGEINNELTKVSEDISMQLLNLLNQFK